MALLPFKPMPMKVLQCSFLSGIRLQKAKPLLKILQPKIVLFPEDLRQQISFPNSSSHSFSVFYYTESETLGIPSLKDSSDLEIATDLATRFSWIKLKQDDLAITRLERQLLVDHGKHWLLSGNKLAESSQNRPSLHWGLPDLERLLNVVSKSGINGSMVQGIGDAESECAGIIHIHEPKKALIEVQAASTVINAADEKLAALIYEAICTLLDGI